MKPLEYDPDRKWIIEVTERQLSIIINCVEDIHRFLCGDLELFYTTSCIGESNERRKLREKLDKLQRYVTPMLINGSNYDWCGSHCPDEAQKKAIQHTYAIYRNLRHCIEAYRPQDHYSIYQHETLTCGVPLATCRPMEETINQKS